jgi:response regulator of citrate/malate metabolism
MKRKEFVILVDDSDIDNFIGQTFLKLFGVTDIMVFNISSEALDYLKKTITPPTLMIIDFHMPLINGDEFIEKYKKLTISKYPTDIFLLSASINPWDISEAKKINVGFIEKPLTYEKLKLILNN